MANARTFARSFNGGEVTPEFYGRIDDPKYQVGLALCQNFVILPHGPAANNAGTEFVRAVKNSAKRTRLLPFTFSTTQTMVLEFGEGYFRFHTQGATLVDGVAPYEVANDYLENELFDVKFVQSADVLTLVHPLHPPRELRRLGALSWSLSEINFGTTVPAPSNITATATTATSPTSLRLYDYLVTGAIGVQESALPLYATCTNNLDEAGASNFIEWDAAPGPVDYYNVYRRYAGVFAFIGQTDQLELTDEGILADVSRTPPRAQNPFLGTGNYPSAVTYFEQRRVFGGTLNAPQTEWLTRSGTESNLDTSIPSRDDDALSFRIAAREANSIIHLVPLQVLLTMTQAGEFRVGDGSVLTPASLSVKPQSYVGSGPATPQIVNNNLVFAAARGGHIRELGFSNDAGGYITGDLSLRATHLFDGLQIVDMAQTKAPYPVVWAVSTNGKLLGMTYIPEQGVNAWHQHSTKGSYESVAVVAEGDEDAQYFIVKRTINGSVVRYVERRASRRFVERADAFFVDAGVRYVGPPISALSEGLAHLEGEEVAILADGAVLPRQTVTGGTLSLERPASKINIGIPITARIKTLPFAQEMQGYGQGRPKNVSEIWLRFFESGGVFAGPDFERLYETKMRRDEDLGDAPDLRTGEVSLKVSPTWSDDGALCIEQTDPLPVTLLSLSMEVAVAG